jgi:pSer/pThr/pTyr-binding forkhead associated (FHA) protein
MSSSHVSAFRLVLQDHTSIAVGVRLAEDLRRVLGDPAAIWYDRQGGMQPGESWWRALIAEAAGCPVLAAVWSCNTDNIQQSRDELDHLLQRAAGPSADSAITLIRRQAPIPDDRHTRVVLVCLATDEGSAANFSALLAALGGSAPARSAPVASHAVHAADAASAGPSALPSSPASRLLLLSIDDLWPPARVELQGSVVTVGRGSGNDVLLDDPAVSRFHLRLVRQRAGWRAEALPNAKPMFVNGERRQTAWLGCGDQVVIGGTVLRLEQAIASPRTAALPTMQRADVRAALAAGLAPELVVESPSICFTSPLRADVVMVGRAPECTVVITSPLVSRYQALLRRLPDGSYQLEAARDATNPVLLDGRPVRKRTLQPRDVLTLGSRAHNQYITLTYLPTGAATS